VDRSFALLWAAIASVCAILLVGAYYGTKLTLKAEPTGATQKSFDRDSGRFARYVAPASYCPGADDVGASGPEQEQVQLCLLNYARGVEGLGPLSVSPQLMRSAQLKAADIVRCGEFDHDACGLEVRQRFADSGYFDVAADTAYGENLAWGDAYAGSPRGALLGWLESREHRENLFRPDWTEQGIAFAYAPSFRGVENSRIWVSHFGRHG
jgi:uncharacterized protein YkwD